MDPLTLLYPIVAAGIFAGLAFTFFRKFTFAGVGLGYALGFMLAKGLPSSAPAEPTEWLYIIALLAAIAGGLELVLKNRALRAGLFVLALLVTAAVTLSPLIEYSWEMTETILQAGAFVALGAAFLFALCKLAERPRTFAIFAAALSAAVSLAIGVASSALLAQLAGVLTALFVAAAVLHKRLAFNLVVLPFGLLTLAHLAGGHYYASLPLSSVLLFLAAPLLLLLPSKWGAALAGLFTLAGLLSSVYFNLPETL